MNMQLFWEIMFFTSPLIAGGIVALSRPVGVARYLGRFHNWLWLSSNKQVQDAGKKGFFRKYIVRPINGSLLSMARWTQGIENEFIRCGVRIASYIYSLAIFFALLALAVYVVVSVVIIIAIFILIFWFFWFVLVPMIFKAMNGSGTTNMSSDLKHLSSEEKQRAHDEGEKWSKREREGANGLIESTLPNERSSFWNFDDNRSGGSADERSKAFDAGADNDKKQNKN